MKRYQTASSRTTSSKVKNSQAIKQQIINNKLKKAIVDNDVPAFQAAIEEGASLNNLYDNMNAAHFAASNDKVEILRHLIEVVKIDLSITCDNGLTAIHIAVRDGSPQSLKYLISEGCKITEKDGGGWTPLHHAAARGHLEIIDFFIKCKVDIEAKSDTGWTPLHCAANSGHANIVEVLIKHGADFEAEDNSAMSPISFAAAEGNVEVIKILIGKGATIEAKNASGNKRSPLHDSVEHKKFEATKCLIESGANIDALNFYDESSLNLAIKNADSKTVKYLFENGAEYFPNPGFHYNISFSNYIKFGSFLQNLCRLESSIYVEGIEEIVDGVLKSAFDYNEWMKFATLTLRNYILKTSAPVACLGKIETCDILPAAFKAILLDNIKPLYEDVEGLLESIDTELLFLSGKTSDLVPYSMIDKLSSLEPGLNESSEFYEKFPQYKTVGTYIAELANTEFTPELSLLSGLIMSVPSIRDGLQSLLKLCIPAQIREILVESFQECRGVELNKIEFSHLPEKVQEIAISYAEFYIHNAAGEFDKTVEALGSLNITDD